MEEEKKEEQEEEKKEEQPEESTVGAGQEEKTEFDLVEPLGEEPMPEGRPKWSRKDAPPDPVPEFEPNPKDLDRARISPVGRIAQKGGDSQE